MWLNGVPFFYLKNWTVLIDNFQTDLKSNPSITQGRLFSRSWSSRLPKASSIVEWTELDTINTLEPLSLSPLSLSLSSLFFVSLYLNISSSTLSHRRGNGFAFQKLLELRIPSTRRRDPGKGSSSSFLLVRALWESRWSYLLLLISRSQDSA